MAGGDEMPSEQAAAAAELDNRAASLAYRLEDLQDARGDSLSMSTETEVVNESEVSAEIGTVHIVHACIIAGMQPLVGSAVVQDWGMTPVDLEPFVAEMRAVNEALANGASLQRWRSLHLPALPPQQRTIDVGGRQLNIRVFRPDDARAVYLETHGGGGWSGGSAAMCDVPNADLAQACSVVAVAVDHRLAPAHPFPAAPDDCEAAALWLLEHAPAEFGVDRLLIGGRTAGAHLAMLTALRLRDRHGVDDRIAGLNLVNGLFDLSMTPSQRHAGSDTLITNADDIRRVLNEFMPGTTAEERRHPSMSPLYADLTGMPPRCSPAGCSIHSSMTRCSCQHDGELPGMATSSRSTLSRLTGSSGSIPPWPMPPDPASTTGSTGCSLRRTDTRIGPAGPLS